MSDLSLYKEGDRDQFPEQWEGVETCPVCGEQLDAVVRSGIIGRLSDIEVCSLDGDLILHDLPSKILADAGGVFYPGERGPTVSHCQITSREGSEPLFNAELEKKPDQEAEL